MGTGDTNTETQACDLKLPDCSAAYFSSITRNGVSQQHTLGSWFMNIYALRIYPVWQFNPWVPVREPMGSSVREFKPHGSPKEPWAKFQQGPMERYYQRYVLLKRTTKIWSCFNSFFANFNAVKNIRTIMKLKPIHSSSQLVGQLGMVCV